MESRPPFSYPNQERMIDWKNGYPTAIIISSSAFKG